MKKTLQTIALTALLLASLVAGVMIQDWTGLCIGFVFAAPMAAAAMGLIKLWDPQAFELYLDTEDETAQ